MSYPNQKIIKIKTISVTKAKEWGKTFLGIFDDIWHEAVKDLRAQTFILYCYLSSNSAGFDLKLSQVAVSNATGLARSTYYNCVHELIEKGYLVETSSNHYDFMAISEKNKEKLKFYFTKH